MDNDLVMLNLRTKTLFDQIVSNPAAGLFSTQVSGATILDFGIAHRGSIRGGIDLAKLCMADLAEISIVPCDHQQMTVHNAVFVRTDQPLMACLGAQYAGWPVQSDDYFAMGSGPMRAARGREEVLLELNLTEKASAVSGVLESDQLPTMSAIELIAEQCGVSTDQVFLAVAPSTSIAGSVQVVARAIETAIHKLHELKFEISSIVSATGHSPLPPPAKPGDMVAGIGRTNDAILYGATVTLWVDCLDEQIDAIAAKVPSSSSSDHGQPFAMIFKRYNYDFYQVDPLLFSPAVVTIHNLRSGKSWSDGGIEPEVLRQSFFS